MKIASACHACHKPISGRVVTALGHDWHPAHFICQGCARPITDENFCVGQGQPYHVACRAQSFAKRCIYCRTPLLGRYLVDYFGAPFCSVHAQEYPTCTFCSRLVPSATGDRAICSACRGSAIVSSSAAKRPVEMVGSWLANRGLRFPKEAVSIELCDHAKLSALSTAWLGSTACLGLTRTTVGHTLSGPSSVAVLSGLPESLFEGVVAHELGHAWLHQNQALSLSPNEAEGLCELLSFCFYKEATTNKESAYRAESIERNPDAVYGGGFRLVYRKYVQMGLSSLFQFVKAHKRLPA